MEHVAKESLGQVLRARRLVLGRTQERVAELTGVTAEAIRKLESGNSRDPHVSTIKGLASALELPATALFEIACESL
jgi:transcriptional regulator with XRE-family HTH domain